MQYWYNNNGQQDGPYTLEQIKTLNLSDNTLIFKTGESEWKRRDYFPEISNLVLPPQPKMELGSNSYIPTNITSPHSNHLINYIQSPFNWWKWCLVLALVSFIIPLLMVLADETGVINFSDYFLSDLTNILYLTVILLLVSSIFGYILLFRNWKIIQGGNARTTPGKAVGFCFIPFFNIYWIFQAIHGLSIDQEKYIEDKGIQLAVSPNKGVALATCISALIPYLGIIPFIICGIITFVNQKNISLEIIKNK